MSAPPALVYLETDDEITAVVRRVRASDAGRVVIVVPGRSRATSSVVALRLLARAGQEGERELAIVGDALTRSLAAEAGLAAYATVDDARRAEPGAPLPVVEPQHAAIHVVRGPASDDTTTRPVPVTDEEPTLAVPVARPVARAAPHPRRVRRSAATAGILSLVGILLVGLVAGAAVLPAATITIVPRGERIGPVPYVIEVAEPERLSGTAEASVTVTATGTYEINEPATGVVSLFNWTFAPVAVPAGTFVAAGVQAFATQAEVTVPRGSLTADGRIRAGSAEVGVEAAEAGPAGNVGPEQINVVVNRGIDARLRGFPENPEPRVVNPAATSGGVQERGPRIRQSDIDAALEALRTDLRAQVDAMAARADAIVVERDLPEPTIEGVEDALGARKEEATLEGSLSWEAFAVERAQVTDAARELFAADPEVVPEGHTLLAESTEIAIQEPRLEGATLRVEVSATGFSSAEIQRATVVERVTGRTAAEAEAALADLGAATVELWPGWVGSVPAAEWRIDVRIAGP